MRYTERDSMADLPLWGKSYGCHQFCQLVAAPCHWHGAFKWVRVPSSIQCTKKFTRLE